MSRVTPLHKKNRPSVYWWAVAIVMLLFFVVLQLPAAWILARVMPNNPYLDNVSGNIWRGQGDWHYQNVQGVVSWQARPWTLMLLRLSADVSLKTGDTELQGIVSHGLQHWSIGALNGRIQPDTLQAILPWQWPSSPLMLKDISVSQSTKQVFSTAEGHVSWGGGLMSYPYEGRTERATLPPLLGDISLDKDRLHLALTDGQKQRMGDFYLSSQSNVQPNTQSKMMIDVQLTQRLLLNVVGYHGQAGLDTAVISLRQPLTSLGAM